MSSFLKTHLFSCAALVCACSLSAQELKVSWGKVPDEDLKMTVYAEDTAAAAVVLFDIGKLTFDFARSGIRYNFERHKRIKILKRAGFDYADIAIPFYHREKLNNLRAQIFQPDGTKNAVEKASFYDAKATKDWVLKKFAFPNVQEGAVIEYRYNLESEYIVQLQDWFFQSDIPVRWSEYTLAVPEWFDYVILQQGRRPDVMDKKTNTENVAVNFSGESAGRTEYAGVPVKVHYHRVLMKNVPAMKMESFITTPDDYLARIRFQLKAVQWPSRTPEPYMTTWSEVARKLMEHDDFGAQFSRKGNYDKVWAQAAPLLAGANSDTEKADRLYQFVSRIMTWDEYFGVYTRSSLNKCFEQKKGSAAEMNLMLLALFKEAGFTAFPVLSSTREHGKTLEVYPFLQQFNHVMVIADIEGKIQLFDAGSAYRPPGYPRVAALNDRAWLVNPDAPQWINIDAPGGASMLSFKGALDEDGNLSGKFRGRFEGYDAFRHREELHAGSGETHWQKHLAVNGLEAVVVSHSVQNKGMDSIALPLQSDIECTLHGAAQINDNFLYLTPVLYPAFSENPFKLAVRNYPVEIPHPISWQFVLQVDLPQGYEVEELPESLNMVLADRGGTFLYHVTRNNNMLSISYRLRIDQLVFEPDEYAGLKEFFDKIIAKQAEQVVLKKK